MKLNLSSKKLDLKKAENLHFSQWFRPWVCKKIKTFSNFCFNAKWIYKKCVGEVPERMEVGLDYKNIDLKSPKFAFSKEVRPWFLSKN